MHPSGYVGAGLSYRGVDWISVHAARLGCIYISKKLGGFSSSGHGEREINLRTNERKIKLHHSD